MQLFKYIIDSRKVWLPPLVISCIIFAVLIYFIGSTTLIPFLYNR